MNKLHSTANKAALINQIKWILSSLNSDINALCVEEHQLSEIYDLLREAYTGEVSMIKQVLRRMLEETGKAD